MARRCLWCDVICHLRTCEWADTRLDSWTFTWSVSLPFKKHIRVRQQWILMLMYGLVFFSTKPCCAGCIFGSKDNKILRQRRSTVRLCFFHICVLLWREGSWRSSISAGPHWLYCPFSQLHYHIVSSASCVLSPPLVVLWNLGNFLFTLSKFSQKCPRWPLKAALMWLLYTDLVRWQPVNHTGAPVIKVKEDFTQDYTELYTGSYDCNQTHCLRDIEVSSCCKC